MINTNVLAIDLAKNSFQVCKTDKFGRVIFNKALSRKQLLILLANEKQSFVAMESCGGTHYWCRKAKGFGHKVIAISARRVKAFRQGQKNRCERCSSNFSSCITTEH
jgi:transposase